VAIGETTFGGRKELASQTGAIMDYGSLMYIALQRAAERAAGHPRHGGTGRRVRLLQLGRIVFHRRSA
jgi:hypothetical protein